MVFRFFMGLMIKILRGVFSIFLFAIFGIGAILVSPLMIVLRHPECGQPIVRALWRPIVWVIVHVGICRIECTGLKRFHGTVIVANHPTLIDVMLIVSLIPKTLYVAKHALLTNPLLGAIVRVTSLPDDARLLEAACPYLDGGWNVLVFPEGTRSPDVGLHPFHRGAAQLALRTAAPVVCLGERLSYRILAKHQPIWDVDKRRIEIKLTADTPMIERIVNGESLHAAACRVTRSLEARVRNLCYNSGSDR